MPVNIKPLVPPIVPIVVNSGKLIDVSRALDDGAIPPAYVKAGNDMLVNAVPDNDLFEPA